MPQNPVTNVRRRLGDLYRARKQAWFYLRRKAQKVKWGLFPSRQTHSYTFAILLTRRVDYAKEAITNINSLHFHNSTHRVVFYCDSICADFMRANKRKLDYPKQVEIKEVYGDGKKPWQYYKVETFIKAAQNNQILTDADEVWHADPVVDRENITFLVSPQTIAERTGESTLVKEFFEKPEWLNYRIYTAAFISLPKKLMKDEIAEDARRLVDQIMQNDLSFLETEAHRVEMRRLAEQFAINIAVQKQYPQERITTLKETDGPKDTTILQQSYYGAKHRIAD